MKQLLELGLNEYKVDSRRVLQPTNTLFFCLPGKRKDGHEFIGDLYSKGCRNFVVSKKIDGYQDARFFLVKDVLHTLQDVAKEYRSQLSVPVLAITGSNGKTVTKEWLYQAIHTHLKVYRSPGSYNSQIGVPLAILGIKEQHDLAIIEAGVSRSGEMKKLFEIIQPDMGLLTSIGSAHNEGFESLEAKYKEKVSLFRSCKFWISAVDQRFPVEENQRLADFKLLDGLTLPFEDEASRINIGLLLNFVEIWKPELLELVKKRIPHLRGVSMRMEFKKGIRNNTLISDHYNSDWESVINLIEWSKELPSSKNKVLILSAFASKTAQKEHEQWQSVLRSANLTTLIWIGELESSLQEALQEAISLKQFPSTSELLRSGVLNKINNSSILLKGARTFEFEKIERRLAQPNHGTVLSINMDALLHNWNHINEKIGVGVKKLVMMKATAYGSGLIQMGKFFEQHGADYIGVAYPNEGVALREKGIRTPILVLNCPISSLELVQDYDLEPIFYDVEQLTQWIELADSTQPIKGHINVNTGMNRLGIDESEINNLITVMKDQSEIEVVSLLSHFSASENPVQDDHSQHQLNLFISIADRLKTALNINPTLHIANSQAAIRLVESRLDMVRLGIALYGYGSSAQTQEGLIPVHSLTTHVIQKRKVPAGGSIGYGGDVIVQQETEIATIPVGYADGIPRSLSFGKFSVLINGQVAHSIGRICMDMLMLDITGLEGIMVGDEVEIFGQNRTLEEFSASAETIPYEILVNIGERVERVFING